LALSPLVINWSVTQSSTAAAHIILCLCLEPIAQQNSIINNYRIATMSIRSHSLRLARAVAKEIQPAALPKEFSASQLHHQHVQHAHQLPLASLTNSYSSAVSSRTTAWIRNMSTKPNNESQSADGEIPPTNNDNGTTTVANEGDEAAASMAADATTDESKIAQLESQIKDLKDNLLRSLAEQENTRRIAARDVANAKSYAISSFAKSLLDTSDNLTRALESVPPELRHDHDAHPVLANLYEGITMTDDGLNKAFAKNGLVKFGERGEKFDPNLHEALFEYPDPECEAGKIGQVMKVGFTLNNRVLRPAEVGVVKAA
jgi:molecular chaperone GrpE